MLCVVLGLLAMPSPIETSLTTAETLLMANDPNGALRVLREAAHVADRPRHLRLVVDAHWVRQDIPSLLRATQELSSYPEWQEWANERASRATKLKWRRWMERVGLGLFASGLALLGIGGARSLLTLRRASMVMASATALSILLMGQGTPRLVPLIAVVGSGFVALTHAASAAVDRTRPDARGRLLAVALLGLASAGLVAAVVVKVSVPTILGLIVDR
ncbi:MAG: hypothetical protein AAF449_10615 [Myxococcota bacterium]